MHAASDCRVTIRPVVLDESEKTVVEKLKALVEDAAQIDDGVRSAGEWKQEGDYFPEVEEIDCLQQVIAHITGGAAAYPGYA